MIMSENFEHMEAKRSKHGGEQESSSSTRDLPMDLILPILARVSIKSLCRFRCVSPLWNSIISDLHFLDFQFQYSISRPKLMITVHHKDYTSCTTTSHARPLNDGRLIESEQPDTFVLRHPPKDKPRSYRPFSQSVAGLICIWFDSVTIGIYNPSTRESITDIYVPRLVDGYRARGGSFGYDPAGKSYKVLGTWSSYNYSHVRDRDGPNKRTKYRMLALDGEKNWRSLSCGDDTAPVRVSNRSICLNGIVYFFGREHSEDRMDCLIGFNVRMEVFTAASLPSEIGLSSFGLMFMEFNGHIAIYKLELLNVSEEDYIIFWVFEGFDKERQWSWSCRRIDKPPHWEEFSMGQTIVIGGTVPSGELLFRHAFPSPPVTLFYYNMESKTVRLVDVTLPIVPNASNPEGRVRLFTTLCHSESIKSLKCF